MQCTATSKTSRVQCRAKAVPGSTVCRVHGGLTPRVQVVSELARWGLGDAVDDPGEVMLRLVTQSRARADRLAVAIEEKLAEEGVTLEDVLVGEQWAIDDDGRRHKTGEYVRGLVQLESQERDRLAGFAAKAVAAGLAERQVRVAERQGAALLAVLSAVLNDPRLGLSEAQRKVAPDVIRRELGRLQ